VGRTLTGSEWTCGRCGVTVTFMPEAVLPSRLPPNWDAWGGIHYCLGCQRKLAGEARAKALSDGDSAVDHVRANAEGRIEFELRRAANHGDTRVARDCGTNVVLVRQVRERLGAYPTGPA
jgi:hypothetical protein